MFIHFKSKTSLRIKKANGVILYYLKGLCFEKLMENVMCSHKY